MKNPNTFSGSDDEKRASALVTMAYITFSIANAYQEEASDILKEYGRYTFDTKREGENVVKAFDRYHKTFFKYFKHEPLAQKQVVEVYEVIKNAIDGQVLASIEQYNRNKEDGEEKE